MRALLSWLRRALGRWGRRADSTAGASSISESAPQAALQVDPQIEAGALVHPKQDCQALVDASLPFAWQMLTEFGSFHPYAAAMKVTGEIVSIAAQDGREDPPAADLIRVFKTAFTEAARKGEYRATAVFYDVFAAKSAQEPKTDAIAVALDHRDGYSVVTLYPYQIKDKALTKGEPFAQQGKGGIFPPRVLH